MSVDLHQLASRLVRDYTIMAKRHYDMARDCRAIAHTWRQALDDTMPSVLSSDVTPAGDSMVAAPPTPSEESAYQNSFEELA